MFNRYIGQIIQLHPGFVRFADRRCEFAYYKDAPFVKVLERRPLSNMLICDLQSNDEHDGRRVYLTIYALECILGLFNNDPTT